MTIESKNFDSCVLLPEGALLNLDKSSWLGQISQSAGLILVSPIRVQLISQDDQWISQASWPI